MAADPATAPSVVYPEASALGESVSGLHDTLGLAGYPARDFFAPAGTLVVAPEAGTIVKLSGHDPSQSPSNPHGAYGLSEYLKGAASGTLYFITHLGSQNVKLGQSVVQGQPIGTVADFMQATNGITPDHVHIGTSGGTESATLLAGAPKFTNEQVANRGSGSAADIFSTDFSTAPGVANDAARHVPGVAQAEDTVNGIADLVKWPFAHNRILRAGELLAGTILAIIGLLMLTHGLTATQAAKVLGPAMAAAK